MVSRISTVSFLGVKVQEIDVQVHLSFGSPHFNIVGLADKSVAESKERIRAAFSSMGLALPAKRITVNLAPADIPKEGSHYDLPMALGILMELGVVAKEVGVEYIALGELALDGTIAPVTGTLPAAFYANGCYKGVICPQQNAKEALWAGDIEVIGASHLGTLVSHLKNGNEIAPPQLDPLDKSRSHLKDLADVKGQASAKRALEIAAAGKHNLLMVGPPGVGKSMLAERICSILPPMNAKEALEVSMIYSLNGSLDETGLVSERPYRAPHHSASLPSLVGGGHKAKPGEISLAHNGVLFLDELPEFAASTLETLRQPLESGQVHIARASAHVSYPSEFQLIAAMNPCRCGYFTEPTKACSRAPRCANDYQKKISGPLLDRIDLFTTLSTIPIRELQKLPKGESSATAAARVSAAHKTQQERYKNEPYSHNANLDQRGLSHFCRVDKEAEELLNNYADQQALSARAYYRIIKVARTIADLSNTENIQKGHIAEALFFRHQEFSS